MTLRSSLYVGSVMHRRMQPRMHYFRYRSFWLLIDLDELDELSSRLRWFSHNRSNIFSFYDADHGDGTETLVRVQVERQLSDAGVDLAGGRIRLLCMPRTLGYCFNPISIFFCYRADGTLAAVVYQVHNTFGQRHSYVIRVEGQSAALHQRCRKLFYVSPFLDMDMRYDFRITGPDERIAVGISASSSTKPALHAVLTGRRRELTDRNLMFVFLKIPAITIKVIAAIHWEALRLWAKGIRLHRRPSPPAHTATIVTANSKISG
jgi:uncharacterized protein